MHIKDAFWWTITWLFYQSLWTITFTFLFVNFINSNFTFTYFIKKENMRLMEKVIYSRNFSNFIFSLSNISWDVPFNFPLLRNWLWLILCAVRSLNSMHGRSTFDSNLCSRSIWTCFLGCWNSIYAICHFILIKAWTRWWIKYCLLWILVQRNKKTHVVFWTDEYIDKKLDYCWKYIFQIFCIESWGRTIFHALFDRLCD